MDLSKVWNLFQSLNRGFDHFFFLVLILALSTILPFASASVRPHLAISSSTGMSVFPKSVRWQEKNIIDLGDVTTSRGTEQLLPIWIRLYGALKTPMFNFKIVKG